MKKYEYKVFTNLSSAEVELKNSLEIAPKFGVTDDPNDLIYMKQILQTEQLLESSTKNEDEEEIAKFRMKSFSKAYSAKSSLILPVTTEIGKKVTDPKVLIKPKKRKSTQSQNSSNKFLKESIVKNDVTTKISELGNDKLSKTNPSVLPTYYEDSD
jgi:hypothetical protein